MKTLNALLQPKKPLLAKDTLCERKKCPHKVRLPVGEVEEHYVCCKAVLTPEQQQMGIQPPVRPAPFGDRCELNRELGSVAA